jgi:hypothetical protein
VDRAVAEPEFESLERLQRSLRSLDAGQDAPGAADAGHGMRRRLARRALEDAIRADNEQRARTRREAFDRAMEAIVERVATRPIPVIAPPPPTFVPAPAPRPAPQRAAAAPATAAPAPAKPKRVRRPRPQPAPVPEFWTPALVVGFRMWDLRGSLWGAVKPWDRPEHEARCLSGRGSSAADVPHTDGRCGHPPCGLYCFKEPEQLIGAFGLPTGSRLAVVGLVALSGKVVEHERGYRAQKARVLAAAAVGRGKLVRVEGDARLRSLFSRPEATINSLVLGDPAVVEEAADVLELAEAAIAFLSLARDLCREAP